MSESNNPHHNPHQKIAVLEKDISQIVGLFHKLDTTIDKLSEVSSSIKQMIAIHEVRLNQQDKTNDKIASEFKELRQHVDRVEDRVDDLENWRWWGAGIVTVAVTAITWALSGLKLFLN